MKEIKSILKAYDSIDHTTTRAALATVVRVEGSSYRRTGARMLVLDNGIWVGGISGGCLEGDALKRARLAIARTQPSLVTYDTTEDDAHQIGVGLGCNGIIDVLLAPVLPDDPHNPMAVLRTVVEDRRQTNVLLTITQLGRRPSGPLKAGDIFRYPHLSRLSEAVDASLLASIGEAAQEVMQRSRSADISFTTDANETITFFAEFLPPELHVVIMGHQYDVFPLVKVVAEAGWRATIVADPQKIHRNVAALVSEVVAPKDFTSSLIDEYTAVILMSHDYKTDKTNLPLILPTSAAYIGMLGPRVRAEKIFDELELTSRPHSEEVMDRIYAPAGLDIGAITPEEIALSMVAEIRAVFSKRQGGLLRDRPFTIHQR